LEFAVANRPEGRANFKVRNSPAPAFRFHKNSGRRAHLRFDIFAIAFTIIRASSSVGFLWFAVSFPLG
jgi:hypothetical protein